VFVKRYTGSKFDNWLLLPMHI